MSDKPEGYYKFYKLDEKALYEKCRYRKIPVSQNDTKVYMARELALDQLRRARADGKRPSNVLAIASGSGISKNKGRKTVSITGDKIIMRESKPSAGGLYTKKKEIKVDTGKLIKALHNEAELNQFIHNPEHADNTPLLVGSVQTSMSASYFNMLCDRLSNLANRMETVIDNAKLQQMIVFGYLDHRLLGYAITIERQPSCQQNGLYAAMENDHRSRAG
ncbi:hypothetical protein BDZ88DRAFT_456487 [Geranomyces variabilis]|nr:hypothetical protein BDZ88DRAFT_456487 [Geranomyces variabilis]KAJ3134991.1 hypothetical protein HDU90_004316 [Geranomyces variabilis]